VFYVIDLICLTLVLDLKNKCINTEVKLHLLHEGGPSFRGEAGARVTRRYIAGRVSGAGGPLKGGPVPPQGTPKKRPFLAKKGGSPFQSGILQYILGGSGGPKI